MPDDVLMDRLRAADPLAGDAPASPSLDALGLTAAALGDQAPKARRGRGPWAATTLSVILALLVGSATAAASLTALTGDPLGRAPKIAIEPTPATVRITDARSPDPEGGAAWGVRLGSAEQDLVCVAAGQIQGTRIGLVGLDGVFRANRPVDADDCAVAPLPERVLAQSRTYLGRTDETSVSVVYGVVGRDIRRLMLLLPDGTARDVAVDQDRVFVVAVRGSLRDARPHLRWFGTRRQHENGRAYSSIGEIDYGRPWTDEELTRALRGADRKLPSSPVRRSSPTNNPPREETTP